MKKTIYAALFAIVAMLAASGAQATMIHLSYELNYYPPNPCIADGRVLAGAIGIFDAEATPFIPESTPPNTPCGSSNAGSFVFEAETGANIFLSFAGFIRTPNPGAPEAPVFAFPIGTEEGAEAVAGAPLAAPLILLGTADVNGILMPNPGPPNLPLFAFASPGTQIGSLRISQVPEPGTAPIFGLGLAALAFMVLRRFSPV